MAVKKPGSLLSLLYHNQQAHTDKTDTYTDGGIRFKHMGVSKAWNVLACCDTMIDGGERRHDHSI